VSYHPALGQPQEPFFNREDFWRPVAVQTASGLATNVATVLLVSAIGAAGLSWFASRMR
jgi:hypothetical protein